MHVVGLLHGMEALVYSNYPREAAASTLIFRRIASGVHWFLCSTAVPMQLRHHCRQRSVAVTAGTDVGCGSLKQPAIEYLTLGLSRVMNGVALSYIATPGTI